MLVLLSLGCSKAHKDSIHAMNRGIEAHQRGQYDLALNWVDKAIQLKPDFAEAHYIRGFVLHEGKKNCALAIPSLQRATQLVPEHSEAWYQLGKCQLSQERGEQARAAFEKSIATNKKHAAALYELGRLAVDNGALIRADLYFRRSIVAKHRSPHPFQALGRLYAQAGYLNSAEKVLKEGLRLTGAHPLLENELGVVLLKGGRHREAIPHLEQAVGSRVIYADFNLAAALLRNGDMKRGRRYLRSFLRDSDPNEIDEDVLKLAKNVLERIPR